MNSKELEITNPSDVLTEFLYFVVGYLKLTTLPNIRFYRNMKKPGESLTFGYYEPADDVIYISIGDRHILDVCRTLAHELIHHKQRQQGKLKTHSGSTGSTEENQANAQAGVIMRLFGSRDIKD